MGEVTPFPAGKVKRPPTACRVAYDFDHWYVDLLEDDGKRPWPRLHERIRFKNEEDARAGFLHAVDVWKLRPLPEYVPPPSVYGPDEGDDCA